MFGKFLNVKIIRIILNKCAIGFLTFANIVFPVPGGPCIRIFLYNPLFCLVFFVAMATSLNLPSSFGAKMMPDRASVSVFLRLLMVFMGCFKPSNTENLEVSLTSEGFP